MNGYKGQSGKIWCVINLVPAIVVLIAYFNCITQILRALGANIGRNVFLDIIVPDELDTLTVEDECVLDHCQIVMVSNTYHHLL